METFLLFVLAYLLGSIPTAVWTGKLKYGLDVREYGSKNAGATNTFRVLGKKPGIFVLSVDVIKGAAATIFPLLILGPSEETTEIRIVCSILAILGHLFPLFAQFRGGKGVATSLGVVIGLEPFAAAICLGLFLIVFFSTHFVSLGAITAALAFPPIVKWIVKTESVWMLYFSIIISTMVIIAHRKNIRRLIRGEENKMNFSKK